MTGAAVPAGAPVAAGAGRAPGRNPRARRRPRDRAGAVRGPGGLRDGAVGATGRAATDRRPDALAGGRLRRRHRPQRPRRAAAGDPADAAGARRRGRRAVRGAGRCRPARAPARARPLGRVSRRGPERGRRDRAGATAVRRRRRVDPPQPRARCSRAGRARRRGRFLARRASGAPSRGGARDPADRLRGRGDARQPGSGDPLGAGAAAALCRLALGRPARGGSEDPGAGGGARGRGARPAARRPAQRRGLVGLRELVVVRGRALGRVRVEPRVRAARLAARGDDADDGPDRDARCTGRPACWTASTATPGAAP